MRKSFNAWYPPSEDQLDLLWGKSALIVLDANALHYPYRVPAAARGRLFDLLTEHRDQLWCPYQAALEYQRNRLKVLREQREIYADLRGRLKKATNQLTTLRQDHPVVDAKQFAAKVEISMGDLARWVDQRDAEHGQPAGGGRFVDPIRDDWDALLDGKVGSPLEIDDDWRKWADERYADEIPPGYEDRGKHGDDKYGDLIIWSELLRKVESSVDAQPVPVIILSNDQKGDWWRLSDTREKLGPRVELFDELDAAGGAPFWIYTLPTFMAVGAERLKWEPLSNQNDLEPRETVQPPVTAPDPVDVALEPSTMDEPSPLNQTVERSGEDGASPSI